MFEEDDSVKNKLQKVQDYLKDAESYDKDYNSPMHVTGILNFSYEKDAPIENWLLNSVERLIGSTIIFPNRYLLGTSHRN